MSQGLEGPVKDEERDVHVLTLRERLLTARERMDGLSPNLDSIEKKGTGECVRCGGPTLKRRAFCSETCRGYARRVGVTVTVDGVKATIAEHRRRIGLSNGTFWSRLRFGKTVVEALHG